MKKIYSLFIHKILCVFNAALFVCAFSSSAFANGARYIAYIECQANHSLYVKLMTLYDITPVFDQRTFDLQDLTDEQKKQECQISESVKVVIKLYPALLNGPMQEGSADVWLNDKALGGLALGDPTQPDKNYSYRISNTRHGIIDISYEETAEKREKHTHTHFNPNKE